MKDESKDLITIPTKADVPALFATEGAIDVLVSRIEEEARALVQDYSTDAGRKAAKALAAKVSRSKTLIDDVGRSLNEDRLAANRAVNELRNMAKDRLDALRDEIKGPALEFEKAEADRVRTHLLAIEQIEATDLTSQNSSAELQTKIDLTTAIEIGEAWEEYEAEARVAKAASLEKLWADKAIAIAREEQAAELEDLRAKATARDEADRAAKELAAAKAREEQVEKDKAEAVKVAAKEAERMAIAETEAAEARHKEELAAAKAREEQAAQAERDRLAQERHEKQVAEERRKADAKHRRRIRYEIVEAIIKVKPGNWEKLVDAMIAGEIPHLAVKF